MARDQKYQPMTRNTSDLAIGVMRVGVGAPQDLKAPGVGTISTLGALKTATLSMKPTFKEHKSAYPQILDFKIADLLAANFKAEAEEIGLAKNLELMHKCIDTLNTGNPHYYSVQALSEFATGGTLSLFTPYAQLKPTLNLNFADDFVAVPFEFEALTNPAYLNKELVYRTRAAAATRSLANQSVTQDVENLGIGMFQIRMGTPVYDSPTGVMSTSPARDAALAAAVVAAEVALAADPANVPLQAALDAAKAAAALDETDSVGAIKSAALNTNPTFKEHFSGFPKVKDLVMLESSTITVATALEEISAAMGAPLVKGAAVQPWDVLFDASVNGSIYYAPVEIVANLVTGGVLSFWLPNCQIVPAADYAPGNDWASMPFSLESQVQNGIDRIYMQYVDPNGVIDPVIKYP